MSTTLPNPKLGRRGFLKAGVAAAGGLFIGFHLPESDKLEAATTSTAKLNAFIHIGSDDIVLFSIHKSEMGQGPMTSLSQLLAEELDCDWKKVRTEFAPVDPAYGPLQGTFGSMSIRTCWDPLRKAGASAREMLLEAAAQKWGVEKSQLRAENGQVINTATNARLSYGSLADAAGKLPAPAKVALKDPKDFHLIGTSPEAAGHPAQSERHCRVWPRCTASRHGLRRAGALSGLRRQGRQLRRHKSQGRSRRESRWSRSRTAWPSSPTTPGPPWKAGARCRFSVTRARTPISAAPASANCS